MDRSTMGASVLVIALSACGAQALPADGQPATSLATPLGTMTARAAPSPTRLDHEGARVEELRFVGDLYDVPNPLPAGKRGELMRLQAIEPIVGDRAYLMLYHSVAVSDGSDIGVSGTLWLPSSPPPAEGYPIASFGPGTHAHFSDACPYSNFAADNPGEYWGLIEKLLHAGFVVAYTDYHGLGTRHPYPYAVGESMTRALLDAGRAARDLLGDDASDRVFLIGHSVGAEGVMAALNFGPEYDEGLKVLGAVVIDGFVDHRTIVEQVMTGESDDPAGIRFGVLGYSRAYPELRPDDVFNPVVIETLAFFDDTECNIEAPFIEGPLANLIHTSPLDLETWAGRIDAGIPTAPSYPVFYPVADLEPDAQVRVRGGERVAAEIRHYPNSDHYSIINDAAPDAIDWMRNQLAASDDEN